MGFDIRSLMKFNVKVGQCMTVGVLTLPASASVREAAVLLKKSRVGSVIIVEKGKAIGILTERDIAYKVVAAGKDPVHCLLKSVMSKPLKVISADQKIESAALALKDNKVKRLPVVDKKGQLVGIVSEGDLLRAYPGMVDIMAANAEMGPFNREQHTYSGVCEKCSLHSDQLKMDEGKLVCEDCMEEEEV